MNTPRTPASYAAPFVALLLAAGSAGAQTDYSSRSNLLFNSLSTRKVNTGQHDGPHRAGRTGFWTTQGRLARNITNSTTWSYLSASITDADGSADAGGANGGFSGWPGMDTWPRWNQMFPQSIKDQYYTEFTTMPNYGKGSTPNQKMMWAVACRIACETWGTNEVTQVSNAKYGYADKTGRDYILAICDKSVKYNFEERWAKHYLIYTLGPLRSIADLSTDAVLRNKARMTWNWGFMDIASCNFNGRWSIPAGRGGLTDDGNSFDISEYASWLMFGGPSPASLLDADQSLTCAQLNIPAATPPPALPEMMDAATNRAAPYTRRGLARLFETQFATTYMTKGYTLYSQLEGDTTLNADGTVKVKDMENNGVPSNDWNSERWALMWDDAPTYGNAGLTMKAPTGYGWCQGCGLGPYEDVVQHEGTLVGILNIPTNGWQYTRDTIPTNTLAVINETATTGRLFLHYNNVLVSIYRTDPGVFQFPAPYSTFCDKRGFALETASPADYPQATAADRLAAFRNDILTRSGVNTNYVRDAVNNRMIYTNRFKRVLDITYGLGGKIDGNPLDYEAWPLNESPWSYQQQMGNMFVFGKDRTLLWNYKDWTEATNHRPILTTTSQVVGTGGSTVDVNLAARVSDADTPSTNLLYRILGANNGTAELLGDGRTVRFTPSANFSGAGSFSFAAGDQFPHARQILHYSFDQPDPVAGNSITDVSTVNRHGTLSVAGLASAAGDTNTPAALGRHSTKSLRLTSSGVGSARFSRQVNPASLRLANEDWTFGTWFNRMSHADDDFICYVGSGGGFGGSGDELQVYCPAQQRTVALRHYSTNGTLDVNLVSAATVGTNEWHHLAVSFERMAHNRGHVRLYLDGVLSGTASNVTWALNQAGPIYFGGPAANTVFNRNYSGLLDDLALWRVRFEDGAIARLASGPAARLGGLEVSNTVNIVTPPLAPQGLVAELINNTVTLSWNAVGGAASYSVQRGPAAGGPFTALATGVTSTSFADNSGLPGVNYFYVVSAVNAAGESAPSGAVSAMRLLGDAGLWQGGVFNAWPRGARITLPGYTRSETLTNIPLLVTLSTNIPGFSYAQFASPTGADLRFGDDVGARVLNHEIETWNTNGASQVWVQVPRLTNGAAIAMFWGNPAATTPPAYTTNGAAWTNGYVGVYHLNSTTVTDSSATPQNASANSATATTGIAGGGLNYNGTSQNTTVPHHSDFNLPSNFEIQGWFKMDPADKADYRTLTSKQIDYNNRNWWIVVRADGTLWWKSSPSLDFTTSTDLANSRWHHFSAIHDGSVARLYVDGAQVATDTSPGTAETQSSSVYFGYETGQGRYFKGPLDEFRISNVKRSPDWVWAVYQNIASNSVFTSFGAAVSNSPTSVQVATLPASAVGATTATANGDLIYPGPSNAVVTVYWGATDQGTNAAAWANSLTLGARTAGSFSTNLSGLTPGATYSYRCFASNATSVAWAAVAQNFTTPAAPPASLAGVPAGGQVLLAWSPAGSGSYQIKRATTNGGPYTTQLAGIVGTNFADPTVVLGTTYYYVVNAVNGGSASADSPQAIVLPVPAPTGVVASPTNAAVTVTWNAVAGATSYNVRRSLSGSGPFSVIQSNLAGTSFSDTGLSNGTPQFYVVSANSPGFESADSAPSGAVPLAVLPVPTGLVGYPANSGANLTWNAVSNATAYNVKRSTTNGGPYSVVAGGLLAPNFTDAGLVNGTNYYYVVSASFGLSESVNSTPVMVTPAIPPTTFTNSLAGAWGAVTWLPNPPGQPMADFATTLVFNNGSAINSTNNLGLFLLNKLQLVSQSVTLSGDGLFFIGTNAGVTTLSNVAHTLGGELILDGPTLFSVGTNTTTLGGAISGGGGIVKSGGGTLVLAGTNSYAGSTTVSNGVLNLRSGGALGLNSAGTTVANGATLQVQGGITIEREPLTVTGEGSGGALRSLSGNNTWSGDITARAAGVTTRVGCDSGALTIAGDVILEDSTDDLFVLQGNGNITITGRVMGDSQLTSSSDSAGVRTLAGDNTYTGMTDLNGGTLVVSSINSVNGGTPALEASSLGAPTTVANGTLRFGYSSTTATLRYTGDGETTDRIIDLAGASGGAVLDQSGSGLLKFTSACTATGAGSKTLTLQGSTAGVGEIAGAIPNNSAANRTSVTKTGSGTWILSGANPYTGPTTVSAGRLILRGSVGGSVVANSGGTFSGTGTVASNLTINTGAVLEMNVTGLPGGGAQNDQIYLSSASSTVTLGGALTVVATNEIPTNTAFVIVNNIGSAPVSGAFAGKPQNATFTASQYTWRISYTGGNGNDVTLTALSPVLTPPAAPINLVATPVSWKQIDLAWTDASADEAGFVIERSSSPSGPFLPVGNVTTNSTSFSDTSCAELTTYYYRVRAYRDFASYSGSSNIASATTPLMPLLGYEAVIVFNNYPRTEPLTNFPVRVVLGTNVPGFSYATFLAPTPDELRFKASDGVTDLPYEVEQWDTDGSSHVWVRVPVFTNGCSIIARWGNPNLTEPPASEGTGAVWSNGYIGVWHLAETSEDHLDSSPNRAVARVTQAAEQGTAAGVVGGGDNFNGSSTYVSLPDMGTEPFVTVECWANLNATPADATRGLVSNDAWGSGLVHFRVNNSLQVQAAAWNIATISSASNAIAVGNWFYSGYVMAGSGANNFRLFLNGNVVASTNGAASNNLTDVNIAREYNGRYLNARMDEVRLSNVPRSTNWLWATYQNIGAHGSFNSYGTVSPLVPFTPPQPVLGSLQSGGGQFQFQLHGTPGYIHTLQASTNLTSWVNVSQWTPLTMPVVVADTNLAAFPHRFYRVVITP
jgi:autotransporter-associated beta strand protein